MEIRKVIEVIPDSCPHDGPGNCAGCEHCDGIQFYDRNNIEVNCLLEEEL